MQTVAKQALPTVVKIESIGTSSGSTGSGIILSEDGEILTNNHVAFEGIGGTIEVFFNDGTTAEAEIVGFDKSMDIALIKAKDVSDLPDRDARQVRRHRRSARRSSRSGRRTASTRR